MSWDSCGTIGGLHCEDGQLWELTDTTAGQHIYTHITHCPDCNPSGLDVETWHDTQAADTTDSWLCDTCQGTRDGRDRRDRRVPRLPRRRRGRSMITESITLPAGAIFVTTNPDGTSAELTIDVRDGYAEAPLDRGAIADLQSALRRADDILAETERYQ